MNLVRKDLDFEKTISFFIEHMNWKTAFSKKIIDNILFESGHFFTFQPDFANLEKLYNFSSGGILSQKKGIKNHPSFIGSIYVPVPNVKNEICDYILKFLISSKDNITIFEDFESRPEDKNLEIKGIDLAFHGNEVYYVAKSGTSLSSINSVIFATQPAWHSLIVLANNIKSLPYELGKKDFDKICDNAFQIVTTAYDGEGFVFWERTEKQK